MIIYNPNLYNNNSDDNNSSYNHDNGSFLIVKVDGEYKVEENGKPNGRPWVGYEETQEKATRRANFKNAQTQKQAEWDRYAKMYG